MISNSKMKKSNGVQKDNSISIARYLKMSFPDVMVDFPTTRLCKKMQILQKSPEDVKLFNLNSPKL